TNEENTKMMRGVKAVTLSNGMTAATKQEYISCFCFFFCNDTATTEIYTLSLHDALPIYMRPEKPRVHAEKPRSAVRTKLARRHRSEEHTSELQSLRHLVCRLLLEKKK